MTTGWPQRFCSLSASSLPLISTPEPGPRGRMNFTVRWGQDCADDCADADPADAVIATRPTARKVAREFERVTACSRRYFWRNCNAASNRQSMRVAVVRVLRNEWGDRRGHRGDDTRGGLTNTAPSPDHPGRHRHAGPSARPTGHHGCDRRCVAGPAKNTLGLLFFT